MKLSNQPYIYLHGFCSSPTGRKARFFKQAFADAGVSVFAPDLNLPRFHDLTIERQIQAVREITRERPEPAVLIGSSMGGLVAIHYAARYPGVERLVLMAPALTLADNLRRDYGPEAIDAWQKRGFIEVPHYGHGTTERISFALYDGLLRLDTFSLPPLPLTLILQGTRDCLCRVEEAERFAVGRPEVRLVPLDTDHRMHDQLDRVWEEMRRFLFGGGLEDRGHGS